MNTKSRFYLLILILILNLRLIFCVEEKAYCDEDEDLELEASYCTEVTSNDTPELYNQDDFNILAALGTSVLNKTYPTRVDSTTSFAIYDEMPHPVPTGASSYFMVLFTVIFTWYFNKFIHHFLKDTEEALDLFPITDHFPSINLYMLQQSRRESILNRDVRNTWAWLASYNLLKPSDPLVNPDEIFRRGGGGSKDSPVGQDVWATIKAVLRVNALEEFMESYYIDKEGNDSSGESVSENTKKTSNVTLAKEQEVSKQEPDTSQRPAAVNPPNSNGLNGSANKADNKNLTLRPTTSKENLVEPWKLPWRRGK